MDQGGCPTARCPIGGQWSESALKMGHLNHD
ncbi:uncharacterized protein G2W53_000140 [Senna tora]|uniref:Uncharacterized protein n=1 Tax=Senna tora TaxID=362788 RepID=A0A834XDB0_9FABA|nr:uncharacterized protein G2W53_000140 [Senna tora]